MGLHSIGKNCFLGEWFTTRVFGIRRDCLYFLNVDFLFFSGNSEACSSGSVSKERASTLVLTISRFISCCVVEQIRLAPEKCMRLKFITSLWWIMKQSVLCAYGVLLIWFVRSAVISVCRRLKDQVLLLEAPMRGVAPMLTAIRKLQTSLEHLTTLHPEFLLLCLLAKWYKSGLSILRDDISEVDQPRDLFLYCYYGWVCPLSLKVNW